MRSKHDKIIERLRTVNEHVSGGGWKSDGHAIEFSSQLNLTSKPASVGEPKCHVQHIVLVILRRCKKVIVLQRKNNVTRGAGHGTLTSTCDKCDIVKQFDQEQMEMHLLGRCHVHVLLRGCHLQYGLQQF